jgi:hypothetical protein
MLFQNWPPCARAAICLMGLVLLPGGLTSCKDRSVGANYDAATQPDGTLLPDATSDPDASTACGDPRLHMDFVWSTHVEILILEPDLDVYEVAGTVSYLGPITVPLAPHPAFDREVQIEHDDGQISMVQYYLPAGVSLPVSEGSPYTFWLRHRIGFEGHAVGVRITRPTSGLVPLLFVADTGSYGRAFSPEDPAMAPLKVYVESRPECPATPNPDCGGDLLTDQLRFDSSTGGMVTDVQVIQGATDELALFGDPWQVVNLASTHTDQPCSDDPGMQVSYLAVNTTAVPRTCDPSRFYVWDAPNAIDVSTWCDVLFTCVDTPDQVAAIQAVSPDAECDLPVADCGPNSLGCAWDASQPVDQDVYDQLCAVSVLTDAPERIDCNVYFY